MTLSLARKNDPSRRRKKGPEPKVDSPFYGWPDWFFERVQYDTNGGCWLWDRTLSAYGYGSVSRKRRGMKHRISAHRAAYQYFVGDPGDLFVCHTCDVRACVNPAHLFLGTHQENAADMVSKLRFDRHFDASEVLNIRAEVAAGARISDLARKHGVSVSAIWSIKERKTWKFL